MVVDRDRRRLAIGADQGRQLPRHAHEHFVKPLGMHVGQAGQVANLRDPAIDRLQQQEAGEGLGPAVGGLHGPQGQLVGPLFGAAQDVGEEPVEPRACPDVQARGDVAVVETELAVLNFADLGQTHADAAIGLVAGDPEPQIGPGRLDRLARPFVGEGVGDLFLIDQVADRVVAVLANLELHGAGLPGRQRQIDDRVPGIGRHVQGIGWGQHVGRGEGLAIAEQTRAAFDRELPEGGQVGVDLEFDQPPGVGPQRLGAGAHQRVDEPVLLLEMLRAQKLAFAPSNPVVALHLTPAPNSPNVKA